MNRGVRRRYHDSDEEFDGDGDGQLDSKRRRKEMTEIEERLENLVYRVGEKSSSSLESNLEGLAGVLEADLSTYKDRITNILLKCIRDMPEKVTIYSTLVGLLNAKNHSFGGEFVESLLKRLNESLKNGDFENALYIVVFMGDLVNCRVVSSHSCLKFLGSLVEAALESGVPQVCSDWFVYAVLDALPWVGKELWERKPSETEYLLDMVERFIEGRKKLHVPMLRVWSSPTPHAQEDSLDSLWSQISQFRKNGWTENHILRHHVAFDASLGEALQHNLPTFIPPRLSADKVPLPKIVFRVFDYTDCPEDGPVLPPSNSIERFLIEQDLDWIIRQTHLERKVCATQLLAYSKRSKVPLNYMILEVIFGHLFTLPKPPYEELFYGSLLIELCKAQPSGMPQVLAQAAELLYQRIETMQPMAFDRFVNWFAYHLSNFQFRWSWQDWEDCLGLDEMAPKRRFVAEVLEKCMRLSYYQRVVDIVPASFAPLVPPKPQAFFKFKEEEALPGGPLAHELSQAIRNRCSPDEILSMLEQVPEPGDAMESDFNPMALETFALTLLNLGSKSFSHSIAALAKYHPALRSLTENKEEAQLCVIRAVYELWSTHPQIVCVLVDKLLKMQIVECGVVIEWVFSEEMRPAFHRMFVWEITESALTKLSRHVDRLRAELKKLEDEPEKTEENENDEEMGEEEQKVKRREALDEVAEQLEGAETVQKNLLLTLFQKFTIVLTEHLLKSEAQGLDFNTQAYKWIVGRFKHMFLTQYREVAEHVATLDSCLFTSDIDPHILEVFHQFCALRH